MKKLYIPGRRPSFGKKGPVVGLQKRKAEKVMRVLTVVLLKSECFVSFEINLKVEVHKRSQT